MFHDRVDFTVVQHVKEELTRETARYLNARKDVDRRVRMNGWGGHRIFCPSPEAERSRSAAGAERPRPYNHTPEPQRAAGPRAAAVDGSAVCLRPQEVCSSACSTALGTSMSTKNSAG
jgi:hypothetical protein